MSFTQYINGPRLYRLYSRAVDGAGEVYIPNVSEKWADNFISYGVILATSYVIRAAGRYTNPTYVNFFQLLQRARSSLKSEDVEKLRRYDFEMKGWPILFKSSKRCTFSQGKAESKLSPTWLLGWLVAHSFGIRMIYPGLWVGSLFRIPLEEARAKFILEKGGLRNRIGTVDGYGVDTMFFDRRKGSNSNGATLVICCEGNAGFYEIGMVKTPMDLGYSILGWNHPGFAGSDGMPYPLDELNAAEAVYDYAVSALGFREDEILLYGWSIGGFPCAHLARNHPKVKGIILDATFDDILPLALPKMPALLGPLVQSTIRTHVNLRISDELAGYKGPVRLIRRTEDEIIAEPAGDLINNRGNWILRDLIRHRYPNLMEDEVAEAAFEEWISKPHAQSRETQEAALHSVLIVPDDTSGMTTADKKELVVKLAEKFMTDYKSSHCTELPSALFRLPWLPTIGYRLGSGTTHEKK